MKKFIRVKNVRHKDLRHRLLCFLTGLSVCIALPSCAPRRLYRPPPSPREVPPPLSTLPQSPPVARAPAEEPKIRERDLPSPPPSGEPSAPGLPDDSSLLAKINPGTPPRRAASLRLTEEGRRLLEAGDYPRALNRLEKTIAIDSTNPYGYYYLAKTHYQMGRYQESLNFLDVAESRLAEEPYWLAEVYALRGENFRALGFTQRAESNYLQALRLNPGNPTAAGALARIHGEGRQPR